LISWERKRPISLLGRSFGDFNDSRAVLQRFEQEHQALAMMDHANIAVVGCWLNVVEFRARFR